MLAPQQFTRGFVTLLPDSSDFKYDSGREITAPASGILEIPFIDKVNGNGSGHDPKSGFNTFRIIHDNGFETWYLHALEGSECLAFPGHSTCDSDDLASRPAPGSTISVRTGQVIAHVGNTGVEGPHLHFEVRKSATQQIIDPFGCVTFVKSIDQEACIGNLWIPVVFADGFEDGTTDAWSETVPY